MSDLHTNTLVSYLFDQYAQEVTYIRSEMHEAAQYLDRQEEYEENERQTRELEKRLELWSEVEAMEETPRWPNVPNPCSEWTPLTEAQRKPITKESIAWAEAAENEGGVN